MIGDRFVLSAIKLDVISTASTALAGQASFDLEQGRLEQTPENERITPLKNRPAHEKIARAGILLQAAR